MFGPEDFREDQALPGGGAEEEEQHLHGHLPSVGRAPRAVPPTARQAREKLAAAANAWSFLDTVIIGNAGIPSHGVEWQRDVRREWRNSQSV